MAPKRKRGNESGESSVTGATTTASRETRSATHSATRATRISTRSPVADIEPHTSSSTSSKTIIIEQCKVNHSGRGVFKSRRGWRKRLMESTLCSALETLGKVLLKFGRKVVIFMREIYVGTVASLSCAIKAIWSHSAR
ncbi:hypothetical protein DH2020_026493 [Rehmannia glutinosa]|uniref:Uncharacterized protein n=1 Tax=Rehmannia glutinosa TaxID=99300 RepID=A0ABR0VWX8_REHGL